MRTTELQVVNRPMAEYPLRLRTDIAPNRPSLVVSDHTRQTVLPDKIQVGDWLRDLGTLRQVAAVEALPAIGSSGRIFVAYFAPVPGIEDLPLGIPESVSVTLWRAP